MGSPKPVTVKLHGIVKDLEQTELGPDRWSDGRNVHFMAGAAMRTQGDLPFANTGRLFNADVIKFIDNGVQQYWVYAAATSGSPVGIGATNGSTHWDLTPAGWPAIVSPGNMLTIGQINGFCFINHPEFGPYYWDNDVTHDFVKLPGWPAGLTCRVMRAHKEFLMALTCDDPALGLIEGQVRWSASSGTGVPPAWVPSATNDAGDKIFSEVGGALVEGISVRDQFFVMKTGFTGVLQYVGGEFVFAARDVFPSLGCLAPGAAVESGNIVYMLTGNMELVKHDGTTYQNILYGVMQDYLRNVMNHEFPHMCFLTRDDVNGQIVVAYPTGVSKLCTEALTYEVATGDCGIRDLPGVTMADTGSVSVVLTSWDTATGTWDTDKDIWNKDASGYQAPQLLLAGVSLGMLQVGGDSEFTTAGGRIPVESYLTRSGIDLDSKWYRKTISGAKPLIEGVLGNQVQFTFGTQEAIDGPVTLLPTQTHTIGQAAQLDFFADTLYLYCAMQSSGGAAWKYSGLVMPARRSGR